MVPEGAGWTLTEANGEAGRQTPSLHAATLKKVHFAPSCLITAEHEDVVVPRSYYYLEASAAAMLRRLAE